MLQLYEVASEVSKVTGTLTIKLFSGDRLHLNRAEILALFRHRYMLMVYFSVTCVLLVSNVGLAPSVPQELRAPLYMTGVCIGAITVLLSLLVMERFGAVGRPKVVLLSPVLFGSIIIALSAAQFLAWILTRLAPFTLYHSALLTVFFYIFVELLMGFVVHFVIPHALKDIRADVQPLDGDSSASGDAGAEHVSLMNGQALQTPSGPIILELSGRPFRQDGLSYIQAEGNYVRVVTETDSHLLPGPFASVLENIPAGLGQQIHRSCWVANRAVKGHRREKRDLLVLLSDGKSAKVALTRQPAVMDWLKEVTYSP